jgi:hypothetical protein
MATRDELVTWVLDALKRHGGEATLVQVARDIWTNHRVELELAGDLFYTWQYEMRWAAQKLRNDGRLRASAECPRGTWMMSSGRN